MIRVSVTVPAFGQELCDFMVDTGASATVLMPTDIKALGMKMAALDPSTLKSSTGVGGPVRTYPMNATLHFTEGLHWNGRVVVLDIDQFKLGDSPDGVPSLLGRDFLNLCHFEADPRSGVFVLEPYRVNQGEILPPSTT